MTKQELLAKREELEKQYKLKEYVHLKRFTTGGKNEGAYKDSCRELKLIWTELAAICDELEDPIPVCMNYV